MALQSDQQPSSRTFYVTGFLVLRRALRYIHLGTNFRHNFHSAYFSGISAKASILSITAA